MAQELNIVERDPNYVNPFKEDTKKVSSIDSFAYYNAMIYLFYDLFRNYKKLCLRILSIQPFKGFVTTITNQKFQFDLKCYQYAY